jgi:Domain of unknown function (DUF1083).
MLKKFTVTIFSVMVIISLCLCAIGINAAAKPTENIKRGSVVIDGQIDEIWEHVAEMPLDRFSIEGPVTSSGYAKMLWDDENLYAIVVITDTTKNNSSEAYHTEDCLEVFFDLNNKKTETYTEKNQFRFLYDIISPLGMRNPENISENATDYIELAGSEPNATQYIYEFRINSKVGIDLAFKENMEIGIDFGYDDNTAGDNVRTGALTWNAEGEVSGNPSMMGTIKLINEEAMPPIVEEVLSEQVGIPAQVVVTPVQEPVAVTAPATNDTLILSAVIALLSIVMYRKIKAN